MRVAVIDLGTFSAILLIAELHLGRLVPLHEERCTIDLEYGTGSRLTAAGILRAAKVLRKFKHRLGRYQIDRGMVVATAAIRHATNKREAVKTLRSECDLPFTILSSKQEGTYSARGALTGLRGIAPTSLVIDIGGGSSEFIVPKLGIFCGLPIGAVWATKAWTQKAPRKGARRDLYYVASAEDAVMKLRTSKFTGVTGVVGLGGTITTLAAIKHRMRAFDADKVHGTTLSREWIESLAAQMSGMPQRLIRGLVPFDPSRARVLLAGTYLWSGVLNRLNADCVTVSARGLRWGVAAHLAGLP